MLSWDAPEKNSCTHASLLPGNLKKTNKTTLHEDTDLIMDRCVCVFSNKSFFLFAFSNICTVEYGSSSPTKSP